MWVDQAGLKTSSDEPLVNSNPFEGAFSQAAISSRVSRCVLASSKSPFTYMNRFQYDTKPLFVITLIVAFLASTVRRLMKCASLSRFYSSACCLRIRWNTTVYHRLCGVASAVVSVRARCVIAEFYKARMRLLCGGKPVDYFEDGWKAETFFYPTIYLALYGPFAALMALSADCA